MKLCVILSILLSSQISTIFVFLFFLILGKQYASFFPFPRYTPLLTKAQYASRLNLLFIMLYKVAHFQMKPQCMTIQIKAVEKYFHVVLFIMLYKVTLTFKSVNETLACDHSNKSYWTVYFHVVQFIMLYKVVLTFKSVDETLLLCDHLSESEQYSLGALFKRFKPLYRRKYDTSDSVCLK